MKFVHIADMHFDTPFTQINNSELGKNRRFEQRKALKKIIEYIKENEVDYLFIAGDFYEHSYIRESTIEYINKMFKEIENTKIFITPGNHDPFIKNSFYSKYNWNKNVHIFSSKLTCVEEEDACIFGYGFDDFYYTNSELETFELTDRSKPNILITHATLDGTNNVERQYNAISRKTLENIGFDYVALGHIHKTNYTENENIVYPGSTISMGFDELGNHGMVVGELDNGRLTTQFVPLDEGEFKITEVDVSTIESLDGIADYINCMPLNNSTFYEIYLVGKKNFEIDLYNLKKSVQVDNVIKLKDMTKIEYNLEKIAESKTLKGLFVREMLERFDDENYNNEVVQKALEIGLEIFEK